MYALRNCYSGCYFGICDILEQIKGKVMKHTFYEEHQKRFWVGNWGVNFKSDSKYMSETILVQVH